MTLENECTTILANQMGPAARIFLNRTCNNYLKKEASKLEKSDLPLLAKYCFSAVQSTLGIVVAEKIRKDLLEIK